MKKQGWIRWPGLIVFVALSALIVAFWLLIVDALVKRVIEATGTKMVGAKVELDSADLSLFPLGLALTRLQVTNPDAPMTNAVEIARIALTMDGLNLLRRKVIVEEMTMGGLKLNTPRTTSGAVQKPAEPPAGRPADFRCPRWSSRTRGRFSRTSRPICSR